MRDLSSQTVFFTISSSGLSPYTVVMSVSALTRALTLVCLSFFFFNKRSSTDVLDTCVRNSLLS